MARTRISSKYQVVIPKEIREELDLRPGQELRVVSKGRSITLIPDRPISSMRGFVRGIRTSGFREKKDRL
jgi:AbrB family looped-hinge helix DNA binding protein